MNQRLNGGLIVKKYGVNELRRMFLEFFESKGHLAMKSFSLVPHNDKSLLLINSGMAPLKPYFTGAEIPPRRRVTTCQIEDSGGQCHSGADHRYLHGRFLERKLFPDLYFYGAAG